MSELPPIPNYLCEAVDGFAASIEYLVEPIERACQIVTQTLLNDGKVLVCGNGYAAPIAGLLTTCLMHQQEFERPSLPAINLSADSSTISAIAKDGNYHNVFAKQIRAMGNPGDCLIVLSIDGNCGNIVQAAQTAHEKNIHVIAINGFENGKISDLKLEDDIEIALKAHSTARATEAMLITSNALCNQIETELFGVT